MKRKRVVLSVVIGILIIAVGTIGIVRHRTVVARSKTVSAIKENQDLLKDAEYTGLVSLSLPGLTGNSYLFKDENYAYYVNMDGFVERIDALDMGKREYPEKPSESFSLEKAVEFAVELFDGVFAEQERKLGKSYKITPNDFNGGDYMVTIVLLDGEKQTGNKASISIDGDGKLISSMYIQDTLSEDERLKEISEERAKELALEYFYEVYADDLSHAIKPEELQNVEVGEAERIVLRENIYWDVDVNATYKTKKYGGDSSVDPGNIRMDARTGEYVGFASIFK